MATTISTDSPKLTADVASRAEVFGGRGLVFDGASDYLTISEDALAGKSQGTISFWTKTSGTGNQAILGYHRDQWSIRFNKTTMFLGIGGTTVTASSSLDNSAWGFHTITFNSGTAKFYKDGELYHTATSYGSSFPSNNNGIFIGKRNHPSAYYYNGSIADVKIHSSALSESDITSQYLKPESVPSPSTLVAWYPMSEANPESPQSIVYDHSKKGLSSEKFGTADNDWNVSGSYASINNGVLSYTGFGVDNDNFTYVGSTYGAFTFATGKLYKLVLTLPSGGKFKIQTATNATILVGSTTYASGTHTFYLLATSSHNGQGIIIRAEFNGSNFTITDYSLKEVLMGQNATTNFFGDEIVNDTSFGTALANGQTNANFKLSGDGSITGGAFVFTAGSGVGRITIMDDASTETTFVNTKTYQVQFTISSSGNALLNFDWANGGYVNYANGSHTLTAIGDGGNLQIQASLHGNDFSMTDISIKEVGISSSGFTTAQNEPVIPQIPLVRYNEKMLFQGNTANTDVDLGTSTQSLVNSSTKSVSAWVQIQSGSSGWRRIIVFQKSSGSTRFGLAWGATANKFLLSYNEDDGHDYIESTSSSYTAGSGWYHVVGVQNGANVTLYVNGVSQATASDANASPNVTLTSASTIIGRAGDGNEHWEGNIEEVSIFNTALSITEVQELFNDGVALDATTHSKSGNLLSYHRNDGVTTWQDRRGWSYLNFDGTGDFVQASLSSNTVGQTYSFWWNTTNTGINNWIFALKQDSTYRARFWQDYAYQFRIGTQADSNYVYVGASGNSTGVYNNGAWHHILVYIDNTIGSSKVYANGVALTMGSGNGSSSVGTSNTLVIGNKAGSISQFAVWSGDKTSSASGIYATGVNGNLTNAYSTDLIGYWKLNNATTVTDLSSNGNNGTVNGNPTLNTGNTGTVAGSPDSITIREGLNSNKDGLGFPLRNDDSNTLRLSQRLEHLVVPYTKALSATLISDAITVECWVKFHDHTSGYNVIASNATGGSWVNGWSLAMVNNELRFTINNYNANKAYAIITDFTKWYHLVGTYDRSLSSDNIAIYVDLVKGTSGDYTTAIGESNKDLHIGYLDSENVAVKAETCLIDELRIYNRVLTAFEADGSTPEDGETVTSGEIAKNYKHGKGKHKND